MTEREEREEYEALVTRRLDRTGLLVTLDKGFKPGVYCALVEYDELADRIGFAAARRLALGYCERLKAQMGGADSFSLEAIEDASRYGSPGRKRDLESTFLSFGVTSDDGGWHDAALKEQFQTALLRTQQRWDQAQARKQTRRRQAREDGFRRQLAGLLSSAVYADVDATVKDRLLNDVTAIAFPQSGWER
jgi:hypothetical protein